MISKEDIKIICNYIKVDQPKSVINYIESEDSSSDEYKRSIIQKNRNLALDVILEDKVEEYDNRFHLGSDEMMIYPEFSVKVKSMNVLANTNFKSNIDTWNDVIDYIESNTKGQHSYLSTCNLSTITYNDTLRKIVARLTGLSNMIAQLSRKGPANIIIAGVETQKIFKTLLNTYTSPETASNNPSIIGSFNGSKIIISSRIDPDKVIIGRIENDNSGGGLMMIDYVDGGRYNICETNMTFYKNFVWFKIN